MDDAAREADQRTEKLIFRYPGCAGKVTSTAYIFPKQFVLPQANGCLRLVKHAQDGLLKVCILPGPRLVPLPTVLQTLHDHKTSGGMPCDIQLGTRGVLLLER